MSASFHAPGPANLARAFVPSKLFITVPHVAWISRLMSWVARQVFATCSVMGPRVTAVPLSPAYLGAIADRGTSPAAHL